METDHDKLKQIIAGEMTSDDIANPEFERMFEQLYEQLHQRAANLMRKERDDHTLQPTALLHEAYLQMAESEATYQDQNHFVATASIVLRHILVNHARNKNTKKRGGNMIRVCIDDIAEQFQETAVDIISLDTALQQLERLDPTQHRLVELRFFGGMTNRQAADFLGISERTAYNEWSHAKAWLKCQMGEE